jgi:hypothetical protein
VSAGDIKLDLERHARLGFDEAIFSAGKSIAQLDAILDQATADKCALLLTRLRPEQHAALKPEHRLLLDYDADSRTGFFRHAVRLRAGSKIAVVSAGTSDFQVSREAARTLAYYGERALLIADVGVAGLWRLMERIEEIRACKVVIVVAGLDAALPSVIGGLAPGLIIALPTSTGYGVAAGGETALRAALVSCAPGVVVVNIDNGYGAAIAALRALRSPAGARRVRPAALPKKGR